MGLLQRLLGRASEPNESEHSSERSSGRARQSGDDLVAELRALKAEIRALRESLAHPGGGSSSAVGSPGTGSLSNSSPSSDADDATEGRSRRRRGGRGRNRSDRPYEGGPPRDERERSERSERGDRGDREDRPPRRDRNERTSDFFEDDGEAIEAKRVRTPRPPPEDAPTGPLVDFLKERGIIVYEGQDDLNRNEAFEHLARHLGAHFDVLAPFYEKTKRLVASGRGSKFEVEHFTDQERSAAVQFGTLLHRHGMLKDFYYHRSPKKALRVIPTKDGKTGQFLTGGWLEIFVSMLLSKRLRAHLSPAKYQMLYNVKGALPDGREFEADIMAVVEGRMFWLECKTGNWQDYSARFRGLVQTFGVDRNSSGLLLLRAPDASTRSRATDMLDMTVLPLQEVDAFLCRFLGVEAGSEPLLAGMASESGEAVEDRYSNVDMESGEPRSESEEDGEPLENVAPARRLGRVSLSGVASAASEEDAAAEGEGEGGGRRRKRRRRRRGGGGSGAAASATGAGGAGGRLLEPLQIFGEENSESEDGKDSDDAGAEARATGGGAAAERSDAEGSEGGAPRRRRGRRGGRGRGGAKPSPFAAEGAEAGTADAEGDGDESSVPSAEAEESELTAVVGTEPESVEAEEKEEAPMAHRSRSRSRRGPSRRDEDAPEGAPMMESDRAREPRPAAPRARTATPIPAQHPAPTPAPAPVKPPETKAPAGPKVGATGATIAPDWRSMIAGGTKKTDGAAE